MNPPPEDYLPYLWDFLAPPPRKSKHRASQRRYKKSHARTAQKAQKMARRRNRAK